MIFISPTFWGQFIQSGYINNKYFAQMYDVRNLGGYVCTIVKDGDKIVCEDFSNRLADVLKIDDDNYIVSYMEYVKYVHFVGDYRIIEKYKLPFYYMNSAHTGIKSKYPILCKLLTDNIVKFKYADGAIEHWKIKQTKMDIDKNKENGFTYTGDNALIWWNGVGKGSPVDHEKAKSWDYNEDTSVEPTYE